MRLLAVIPMLIAALLPGLALSGCSTTGPDDQGPAPNRQKFGSVWVDAGRAELVVSGYVNQVEGVIELLACGTGGKVHESIFVLYAKPRDLHAGLLLLGLKHGEPMRDLGVGPPEGDAVYLTVVWEDNGTVKRMPAERFVFDRKTKRTVKHGAWIFNGSKVEGQRFLAETEDSLVATYWDPWAILNLASEAGSDDDRLAVNVEHMPAMHTPITLLIRQARKSVR